VVDNDNYKAMPGTYIGDSNVTVSTFNPFAREESIQLNLTISSMLPFVSANIGF